MRNSSVRIKIISLIFITLIPLSILKILEIRSDLKSSIEMNFNSSEEFTQAINISFKNFLEKTWTSQNAIGTAIYLNPDWNENDILSYMSSVLPKDEAILGYTWVNPMGKVITSTYSSINGQDASSRDYIQEIINGKERVVSNLCLSFENNEPIIPIANGIIINNELKGIIVSLIDVNKFHSVFPIKKLEKNSVYGLVDNNGIIIYQSNDPSICYDESNISYDSPIYEALNGNIVRIQDKDINGIDNIGIAYPIDEIGWSSFVLTPMNKGLAFNKEDITKEISVFIAVYIASFIVAMLISNRLIVSIRKLEKASSEVMSGNLEARADLDSNDYLKDIGHVFDNMTESLSKKINEIEEYNNLKHQFLSTMSHELKTPLNIILGCVQLLEKLNNDNLTSLSKTYRKYIKMQKQNSYRLLRLINNIIDVNKLEVNHIEINPSNNDIVKIVEDITLSIVEYTNLKNINVIFDTEVEEKLMAFDADMVERIILNLLSNAIKFTEKGGSIYVNIYYDNEEIIISIKDTGIGIPVDKLSYIFDRFTQVDNTLRRKSEGSGIGLSLVKSLVEMHGGTITVESNVGEGSEFIIKLPIVVLPDDYKLISTDSGLSNVERIHIEFADIYMN